MTLSTKRGKRVQKPSKYARTAAYGGGNGNACFVVRGERRARYTLRRLYARGVKRSTGFRTNSRVLFAAAACWASVLPGARR